MTELKTLKDLDVEPVYIGNVSSSCVTIENLRAEAIKWVKELKYDYDKRHGEDVLMEFFNLTEEDLK